jgi:plasmid maintenance system antidote protein VapI
MEEYTLNVQAIAKNMGMTIGELADIANINKDHLYDVSAGRTKMTADDLLKLAKVSGLPPQNIRFEQKEQY